MSSARQEIELWDGNINGRVVAWLSYNRIASHGAECTRGHRYTADGEAEHAYIFHVRTAKGTESVGIRICADCEKVEESSVVHMKAASARVMHNSDAYVDNVHNGLSITVSDGVVGL